LSELSDKKKYEILAKLSLTALYLVFAINVTLAAIAYFIQGKTGIRAAQDTFLIRNIFLGLAFVELAALQFVKNTLLSKVPRFSDDDKVMTRFPTSNCLPSPIS
jgi:hypothetical protein